MPNVITVQHEVSDQFLMDVMTNTVETGAINYWASIQNVMRRENLDIYEFQAADAEDASELADDLRNDGTKESEIPDIVGNHPGIWYVIDKEAVVKGINIVLNGLPYFSADEQKMVNKPFQVDPDIRSMIARAVADDDADIDAIGCDVIIQAAVFGEIVYG